jgi:hypothetical protein
MDCVTVQQRNLSELATDLQRRSQRWKSRHFGPRACGFDEFGNTQEIQVGADHEAEPDNVVHPQNLLWR